MASGEMSSARSRLAITRSFSSGLHGARVKPQLPITTLVTPCQHEQVPSGSQETWASMWVWPSMKPGDTTCPSASTSCFAEARMRPIVAMRPRMMPTSARNPGIPEPSITVPSRMIRSYCTGHSFSRPTSGPGWRVEWYASGREGEEPVGDRLRNRSPSKEARLGVAGGGSRDLRRRDPDVTPLRRLLLPPQTLHIASLRTRWGFLVSPVDPQVFVAVLRERVPTLK